MKTQFEVIAGSYEEFLLGYYFSSEGKTFQQSFAAHDHTASIRCVASNDHYLASGGSDDRIFIYDLKSRKEHCSLNHHNSSVTCLQFTNNNSHIISGSQDGVLAVVRVGNWQVEKIWEKAHKGAAILDVAVHLSGKLALSLGADRTLATWNLIKGRQAYVINLNSKSKNAQNLEKICWAPDGVHFLLIGGKYTELWSIETGGVIKHIEHNEKVTSAIWIEENMFLTGYETGQMCLVNTNKYTKTIHNGHNNSRIKSLTTFENYIISISSDGHIKIWDKKLKEITSVVTGCRLTCLTAVEAVTVKKEKPDDNQVVDVEVNSVKQKPKSLTEVVVVVKEDESESESSEPTVQVQKKRKQHLHKQAKNKKNKKKKTILE